MDVVRLRNALMEFSLIPSGVLHKLCANYFARVCVIGSGSVHLQLEGHVPTQSTPETVLLSGHHHLPVPCSSKRTGQLTHTHRNAHILHNAVLVSVLPFISTSVM